MTDLYIRSSLYVFQILSDWNAQDPSVLSTLLQQLLQEFVEFCAVDIEKYQRLQFEFHTLQNSEEYSDVEVFVLPKEDVSSCVLSSSLLSMEMY